MVVEVEVNARLQNHLLTSQVHDLPSPLCTMGTSSYPSRTFLPLYFKEQSCSFNPCEKNKMLGLQKGLGSEVQREALEKEGKSRIADQ